MCDRHGEYEQIIEEHRRSGCVKCGEDRRREGQLAAKRRAGKKRRELAGEARRIQAERDAEAAAETSKGEPAA